MQELNKYYNIWEDKENTICHWCKKYKNGCEQNKVGNACSGKVDYFMCDISSQNSEKFEMAHIHTWLFFFNKILAPSCVSNSP